MFGIRLISVSELMVRMSPSLVPEFVCSMTVPVLDLAVLSAVLKLCDTVSSVANMLIMFVRLMIMMIVRFRCLWTLSRPTYATLRTRPITLPVFLVVG